MKTDSNFSVAEETNATAAAPGIVAEATRLLERQPILGQRYFARLTEGTMSHEAFKRSQQQFFFAVRFFSRAIAALAARCPDSALRMPLAHNLAEEHGDFLPARAHDRTFLGFLESLGVERAEMNQVMEGPEVAAFNWALLGVCSGAELECALGCLGIIEFAFADISAFIGSAVVERGWIPVGELVHYDLHAEIDKRHAEEFFAVIEPAFNGIPKQRQQVERGLALGLHLFSRLYEDLDEVAFE